jgi:hypothetical protein
MILRARVAMLEGSTLALRVASGKSTHRRAENY